MLPVVVADKKGKYIEGLERSAFTVYDNKVPQEINFFDNQGEAASIGIIFDLSFSVVEYNRENLKAAVAALTRFAKLSNPENEYFIMGFANHSQLFVDWTVASSVAEELSKVSLEVKMGRTTALYDACYQGIEKVGSRPHPKQAIILISDGQDSISHHTFKELRELLKGSNVLFYSIGISSPAEPGSSLAMEGQAVMDELSSVSGGMAFFPNGKKSIDVVFDRIALELRQQYLLGFKPSNAEADGKWHQVKIKVTPPLKTDLYVRSREGYYAPKK